MDDSPKEYENDSEYCKGETERLRGECDWLWEQLHAERENASRLKRHCEQLAKVAVSYRDEYLGFVNSRLPKAWLSLKDRLGMPYELLQEPIDGPVARIVDPDNSETIRRIVELAGSIPASNGGAYYEKAPLRVGVITDEFMYNYYRDALDLVYLSPVSYREQIDGGRLDFVLYITCWYGLGYYDDSHTADDMHYRFPKRKDTVFDVLRYAKKSGLRVVFQSIEDPTCYADFLPFAKLADVIITSDENMVGRYREDTGIADVMSLPFGVNPLLHNPIGFLLKRLKDVPNEMPEAFFAGTWYPQFPERCHAMSELFDSVRESGARLVIADRTFHDEGSAETRFPETYSPSVIPPFRHSFLQRVHKAFDWTLNVNTVVESPTMCAMRAFEVQALGSLVVSNYALSLSNILPSTFLAPVSKEAGAIVRGYGERDIVNMQIENARTVLSSYTVQQRLNSIFDFANINYRFSNRTVYVICDEVTDAIKGLFDGQSYEDKRLVSKKEALEDLNDASEFAAVFDEFAFRDRNYLLDAMNAFKYVDVDYVCTCEWGDWRHGYNYWVGEPERSNSVFNLKRVGVGTVCGGDALGVRPGFCIMPQYDICSDVVENYELAVIVPVYNNGTFLRDRAWRSLKRSSIYPKMHIYLIDDGSTDFQTRDIVDAMERENPNVTVFRFQDGGSGSASRPRNKGFELCDEPFVTYLDPDNEAVSDGYALLLDIAKDKGVDLVFGTVPMVGGFAGSRPVVLRYGEVGFIEDPRRSLVESGFNAVSVQAAIIRREFLNDSGIKNLERAIGEDTIFFYELMASARTAFSVDEPIHVYYADRVDSAVNTIGVDFFEKSYLVEEYAVRFYEESGLMDEYKSRKLDQFIEDWYVDKLSQVDSAIREECALIIDRIRSLYR